MQNPRPSLPLTMAASLAIVSSLLLQSSAIAASAGQVPGDVPFVGCPADGMMGPVAAPRAPRHAPAIEVSFTNGDTSGRFEVAKVVARLFPTKNLFVQRVIDEGIESAKHFQFGPFPDDILQRRSPTEVDFLTPAGKIGMGTMSWLAPDTAQINGTARLAPDNSLWMLQARLPAEVLDLAPVIIQVVRQVGFE